MTPLHAHFKARTDILQALVDAKAEVDAGDLQGKTALHYMAAQCCDYHFGYYCDQSKVYANMSILIKASGGTVIFAKSKKGKLASELGGCKEVRNHLHAEALRLKNVGDVVKLRPCLAALAVGLAWAEAPKECLKTFAVSKMRRVRVKISAFQALLEPLLRIARNVPPLKTLDRASIRGQLVTLEGQVHLLHNRHFNALDDLERDSDEDEKMACRRHNRKLELTDLGAVVKSLLELVRELLAAFQTKADG